MAGTALNTTNRVQRARIGLGVLLVVLAGCSNSGSDQSGATSATPASPSSASSAGAAAESSSTPSTTPSPSSNYDFLPISFKFKDTVGWSWKVDLTGLPVVEAEVNTSTSPPWKAQVDWTMTGEVEGVLSSLDQGRTPPQNGLLVSFIYADLSPDLKKPGDGYIAAIDTLTCGPESGLATEGRPECIVGEITSGGPSTYPTGDNQYSSSPQVDEAIAEATVADYTPDGIQEVVLHSNGFCAFSMDTATREVTVQSTYDGLDCELL